MDAALIGVGVVMLVAERFDDWQTAGFGLIVAGVAGLATLLPPVQAWIAHEQAERAAGREES